MGKAQGLVTMKSKQLANVLIKILGLSICLYAIPNCISGILVPLTQLGETKWDIAVIRIFSYAIGSSVQVVVGIIIIAKSQTIAGWLFKGEDE